MVKHQVLFSRKNNENSDTAMDPVGPYIPGMVDLEAEGVFCINWDNNGLVKCKLYSVREIELPEWLSVEEWLSNRIAWKYAWGKGLPQNAGEKFSRFVAYKCSGPTQLGLIKLFNTKKFRSAFRASLKAQVETWLADENPKYKFPLSPAQQNALCDVYTARENKSIENNIYYSGRYEF